MTRKNFENLMNMTFEGSKLEKRQTTNGDHTSTLFCTRCERMKCHVFQSNESFGIFLNAEIDRKTRTVSEFICDYEGAKTSQIANIFTNILITLECVDKIEDEKMK